MYEQMALHIRDARAFILPARSAPSGHRDGVSGSSERMYLSGLCLFDPAYDSQLHKQGSLQPLMTPGTDERPSVPWRIPQYRYNHRQFILSLSPSACSHVWLRRSGHLLWDTLTTVPTSPSQPDDLTLDHDTMAILCVCGQCTHAPIEGVNRDFNLGDVMPFILVMRRRRHQQFLRSHGPGSKRAMDHEASWDEEWRAAFQKVPLFKPVLIPPTPDQRNL
jgi:hypothetical protein